MPITILAPAYYQSMDKVKYLAKSAERYGVDIHWYGLGKTYVDWYQVQIIDLLEEISKVTTSHILYTDASDVIVNNPLDFDCRPYIMMSVEHDNRLCAGGWMGPKEDALQALEFLRVYEPDHMPGTRNPQELWRGAVESLDLLGVAKDMRRTFFQVADEPLDIRDGQVYNPRTQRTPFLVHWAGGYTDPQVGKAALIEPIWSQLGF